MSTDAPPDKPKSFLDRAITTTPIVLTVVATVFAGLSGSEMNLAMYWRSVAAQDQSRAGSQWAFAGFKRDRSLVLQGQARTLLAIADRGPATATEVGGDSWLAGKGPPKPDLPEPSEPIKAVQQALADRLPEEEVIVRASRVDRKAIDDAIRAAAAAADAFDKANESPLAAADKVTESALGGDSKDRAKGLAVQAARAELDYRRYVAEARLNQHLGRLYEVRVEVSTAESDRHRVKSKNFFYVMLIAQAGVTVASVALAQRQKSLFWLLASVAGVLAVVGGAYVYLAI